MQKLLIFSIFFGSLCVWSVKGDYIRWPDWMTGDDFSELSIESLKTKDTKEICRDMVQQRANQLSDSTSEGYDYLKQAEILLNFPAKLNDKILMNGFLNQHQTGTGQGHVGQENQRDLLEQAIYRTRFPKLEDETLINKINELRPKSAFLQFKDLESYLVQARSYGDIYAVFKNEVNSRTIYTDQDSLGLTPSSKQKLEALKAIPLPTVGLPKPSPANRYREALVCGELSASDVDYFLIGCRPNPHLYWSGLREDNQGKEDDKNQKIDVIKAVITLLQEKYQVFSCKDNGFDGFTRGSQIIKGSPEKNINFIKIIQQLTEKKAGILNNELKQLMSKKSSFEDELNDAKNIPDMFDDPAKIIEEATKELMQINNAIAEKNREIEENSEDPKLTIAKILSTLK